MSNTRRQSVIFIFISILILLVTIFSFTYAYFSANITQNNSLSVTASISNSIVPIFTASSSDDLVLSVSDADMLSTEANNSSAVKSASQTINVSLLGGSSSSMASCTFSFFWYNVGTQYVPTSGLGSLKEYTLKIVDSSSTAVVNETNISNFTSGNAIGTTQTITSNGTLNTQTYTATVSVYNLNMAQTINGKNYASRVTIGNVVC